MFKDMFNHSILRQYYNTKLFIFKMRTYKIIFNIYSKTVRHYGNNHDKNIAICNGLLLQ